MKNNLKQTQVDQNSSQWWSRVNVVMNIRGHEEISQSADEISAFQEKPCVMEFIEVTDACY